MPQILVVLFVIIAGLLAFLAKPLSRFVVPDNHPKEFLKRGRKPETRKVVVCAGDSITHGFVSANYVDLLRARFAPEGYEFVNAGINGNLAYNVRQRLDDIIACKPDFVTLLVGTNDVNATLSDELEKMYRKQQGIPEKPTLDFYRQNVETIINRLQAETDAKIAIIGLPMLGEKLTSPTNAKIVEYNATLQAIAQAKNIPYLPLYEQLSSLIPADHVPPPYDGQLDLIMQATQKHYLWRKSWDAIASENGLIVVTDHIHLNDKGAKVIAELVTGFLKA